MFIGITLTLLLFSAFFSGTETAVMALNHYRVKSDAEDGIHPARQLKAYIDQPEYFLSIVLLGNTLCNIAAASIFTLWLQQLTQEGSIIAIGTLSLSLFILIFCEMLPKTIAAKNSYIFATRVLPILRLCELILYPLLKPLNWITQYYSTIKQEHMTEHDMRRIVRTAAKQLPKYDRLMLEGILDLSHTTVESLMTPMHLIHITTPTELQRIKDKAQSIKENFVLVQEHENSEHILGLIKINQHTIDIKDNEMIPPYYVQEGTLLSTQLMNFQKDDQTTCIVINEYGKIIGVLEIQEILAEILGDSNEKILYPVGAIRISANNQIAIKPQTRVRDLNRKLNWDLPKHHARTISGLVIHEIGCLPDGPCCILIKDIEFTVTHIFDNKILWIQAHPRKQ
ncbi:CNNM domain-containing protein [Candidatus Comchoanobacter bicostacola]|uniref:CNNM domain-containing protein n=1 Tax=Candidatus Comchoanobacter bicostacola TaxID=2919598 RepID=A0ABY5DKB0_9GAMM|nr:CNNM domain-containing protein [Candidatus Comchoanobacter bicostacola]UTC24250.1 CNNM domain-containing protein [Candidatus Comchoanobacter bicostacola]